MNATLQTGATPSGKQYRFSYTSLTRKLFTVLGIGPARSSVEVNRDAVRIRMGWAFDLEIPRSSIKSVMRASKPFGYGAGVHGWRGRWVVNGSNDGIVRLVLDPPPSGRTLFIPIKPRELFLSLEDPAGFIAMFGLV